ncbi:MAG TPA: PQQ-dependent sugar dehydrogenase [Rhodoblastus sp.]|nr:PQQ-dependent sugar dehydrogenase [Rhodoblastus sp.]
MRNFILAALAAIALLPAAAEARDATPEPQLLENLKKIKLPEGFSISVYASGLPEARQMAWGDKGVLFVGSFDAGAVYAVTERDGHRAVKTILTGLTMPTGVAFRDGALYVAAVNRILRYDGAEDRLDDMPRPKVVYDDLPSSRHHGWKYLSLDRQGRLIFGVGAPCNICDLPKGTAEVRRLDLATGNAETIARGVRNTVGGDIDPRSDRFWFTENARDLMGDDMPADKLNMIGADGADYGFPFCHQGDTPDPKFAAGRACGEFVPPVTLLGAHVAPLGMKFYTGAQFPVDYRNSIFIAEHGSWNRSVYSGGRIVRIVATADGKFEKEDVFAAGFLQGARSYIGRPVDVLQDKDGALLVSDDYAGAIYRIRHGQ